MRCSRVGFFLFLPLSPLPPSPFSHSSAPPLKPSALLYPPVLTPPTPPGDDLCGISLSVRYNSNLISIWHRRADLPLSKAQLLQTVENTISEDLKPLVVQKNYYYKAHAEHAGFSEMVAKAREGESVGGDGVGETGGEGKVAGLEKEKGAGREEEMSDI